MNIQIPKSEEPKMPQQNPDQTAERLHVQKVLLDSVVIKLKDVLQTVLTEKGARSRFKGHGHNTPAARDAYEHLDRIRQILGNDPSRVASVGIIEVDKIVDRAVREIHAELTR